MDCFIEKTLDGRLSVPQRKKTSVFSGLCLKRPCIFYFPLRRLNPTMTRERSCSQRKLSDPVPAGTLEPSLAVIIFQESQNHTKP